MSNNTNPPQTDGLKAAEAIALKEAQRCRENAAKCTNWSAAQGEWCRARDTALDIAEAIAALTHTDKGE